MADTRVVIDVDINTSAAAQGLRDLQQRFNAFTGALNKNNAIQATASRQYADQLMNLVNSGQFFTAEMVRMQTAASRLDKTLAKGQATMGQYFSARFIRNSNAAAQVLSLANARAAALQTQFIATGAAANGMRDAIAVRPYEAFNSALAVSTQKLAIHRAMLMQATTHMINFGKNTQWAGRQLMVGFTVPLTIFGGVAGKVFRELEEQAINFKKVYGDIFTTEAETEQALDAVKELSMEFTKYGIAVKDTMALAGVAAQSGLRNAELMAATTQATRLATLGQMEQAEAMKTIISLQTAFKTSNEGLAESVDFLNIIENQTVLSLQDVAGAIPRVAPVIQGLGGDVKDLAVLLVAMKEGGVTAGEGANALKSSLGRLIVPTRQAKEMAAEFGISLESIVENNRGQLIPMIMELGRALEGVGDLERQQLLSTIFGKFQYARIGALFDNITRDSSQAARAMDLMGLSAQQLGEIAEKELGVVQESVGARFTAAMERAKVAIAPLGEAFLQLSIPVINFFAQLIEKFNALPDFAKKFAVFGSVLIGVVIPVGTMFLGLLMNLIGTLIKFGAIIGIAFKGFTSGGIKGAIQAVSQALNYMSLEEIDAANAAQQLGQSTQIVNAAFRDQVGDAAAATVAIEALGLQYAELIIRMREAAALSGAMGPFAVPGAAMGKAAGAQRAAQAVRRNKGGPIPFSTGNTVPGVGNRDTVPAILTPGEFVVNKAAATENRGLLEAINSGQVRKLNGGGPAVAGRGAAAARAVASGLGLGADDLIAAQMRRRVIGRTDVADDAARAVATRTAGKLTQIEQQRMDAILNVVRREVAENGSISTPKLAELLKDQKGFSAPVLRKWAESNNLPRGGSSPKSPRMWTRKDIEAVVRQKITNPMEKSHFGTKLANLEDVQGVVALRPGDARARLASELQQSGVPVVALTDDWATFSRSLNQAANRSSTEKMTIGQAIDDIVAHADEISFGPAMRNAGANKEDFAEKLATFLRNNYNASDDFTDDVLTAARNSVLPNVSAKVTGLRIPSFQDLAPWSSKILGRQVSPSDIASIDAALRTKGYRIVETAESGLDKRAIAKINWRPGDPIERFGDSTAYNAGGMVGEKVQRFLRGGAVLSRAAQLRKVREAANPYGIEDNALSKVLKLRFNDAKAARGPADFVKSMFSRWEATPTRISPKENTTMLLKGKKPKYKEVPQEDYLADMIVSMNRFSDTVDAFKPIKIGTAFDGGFRVFDGHTRLHAQTVKSLIAKLTGKDTSSMSREELIEGIRLVQRKSLAGELTDSEILRSVSGQRVLSTRANRREVEVLNERPGKAAPMVSMLNRQGRVLIPGVHDKEISAIVEAARKANFYGIKKDPESLMEAMGFISLGGGNRYRYEPTRNIPGIPERKSFVRNMSRRIIDDLIDAGEILPLRRNKGGIIPGFNQGNIVPGVGRADTVPAMLTPGEFVVNKDATRRNLDTLKAINNGTIAGFNAGGSAGATNMGPFIPYNPNSGVPPKFPMTGPSSPIKVDIAEVSDRDTAAANKKAIGGMGGKAMLAQMGIGTLLSIPGMFAGQAAGEAVGGDTGAMVGAMAGSMIPFMLPYGKIGAGLKGMFAGKAKGAMGAVDDVPIENQLWNTIGKQKKPPAAVSNVANVAKVARFAPLLLNPWTAAIVAAVAAMTAVVVTLKKMKDSNEAEYEAGRKLADAMTTSSSEIEELGQSAKQRAKDMESFLNAPEAQGVIDKYQKQIAKAGTAAEKEALIRERDAEVRKFSSRSRKEGLQDFYTARIREANVAGASRNELRNLYQQRSMTMGLENQRADFDLDTTYGSQFLQNQGKEVFEQFESVRNMVADRERGAVSQAQVRTFMQMSDAAYNMSMSVEKIAERDLAGKLAQYIMSGVMTEQQAASVAEAVGTELGDLRIGKSIREELRGIVGVDAYRARYTPGQLALQFAEQDERRIRSLTESTYRTMGELITQDPARDIAAPMIGYSLAGPIGGAAGWAMGNPRGRNELTPGETGYFNIFNQFFSGMADQARRNIGAVIELQATQHQMLEENMAATMLAYNELIAKADTVAEMERLKLEKSIYLTKLQEKLDDAREKRLEFIYGDAVRREIINRPSREARERVEARELDTAASRQRLRQMEAPADIWGILAQLPDKIAFGLDLGISNFQNGVERVFSNVFGKTRDFLPGSMAQLYSEQSIEAIRTQLEGTALQPQFELFLANLDIAGENLSPEFAAVLSEMVADPEVRDAIVIGMNSAFEKAAVGVETGAMGDILAEKIKQEIRNMIIDIESIEGLPTEVVEGLMTAIPQMRAEEMGAIFESMFTLKGAYGIEYYNQVLERFLPLFVKFGEVSTLATSALGGKSLIETVLGDFDIRERLGQDDEAFQDVMRFLTWVSEFDSELQFEFINEKDIDAMIEFGKELERFDPKEFNSNVKSIKKELKGGIFPEEMQEQTDYLIATLNLLNEIEDPEIKARLSADIDETVREALSIIQQMGGATSAAELEDMRGQVFDLLSGVGGKITAAQVESEEKSKPSGSGGAKDDPLGDLMRDLRDTIQNQASIGEKITATGQTAKAIYANLRSMNVDETIIDYLRSMSPEQALEVGQQLLKDRRKLNTLMALIAQETVTAVRDQAEQAEVQRRFTLKLSDSRVMDGLSVIRGMELMDDPQFIEDMRKASQGPKPQKAMREVRNAYLKQRREQEIQMSRMAPDLIQRDIAESQIEQRATQQLSSQGLNQQQIEAALGNEAIMTRIRSRFARGKNIGAEVIDMAKDYASAQRTIFDEINDSVDNIQEAFSNVNGILSAASDRIEQFNIKPLEDQMEAISESTAELSEQQRRLSNSLNDIQDQESDLRDEQKDKEESINTYYNDRIESLEKVAKINEQIAQQQEGQIDLAGALSRGDIAAAAKAANDMRNKAAAARQQQNIDNLRRQQEEEIERVREETEQKIKDLVVEVNGELLTREDIEDKIKSIQDDIYENSLLEYDLQQKITLERKKQSEIAEAQNRLNRGQNLINRIANLQSIEGRTPEETEARRRSTIDLIKAEASVLGGPAAENLIKFLDDNVNNLVQGKWSQEFISSLTGGLTSFSTDFVADFDNMLKTGLTIPVLDLSPDGERPESKPFTPEDFEAMLPDIDFSAAFSSASVALNATIDAMDSKNKEWNDEIVNKNPFDTLISGTRRFKRVIDGAFASIPRKPGSGGGSKKKPDTPTLPEEYFDYDPMGPPVTAPFRQPADSYREDESYLNDGWPWKPDEAKGIADNAVSGIIGWMIAGLPGAIVTSTFGADFTTNLVTSVRTFLQSEKSMEDVKQLGKDIVGGKDAGIVGGILGAFRFGIVPGIIIGALINKFKEEFHMQSPSKHPDIIQLGKNIVGDLDGGIIGGIYSMFKNSLPGKIFTTLLSSFKSLFGLGEDGGSSQDDGIMSIGRGIIGNSEGGIIGGLLNRIQNFPGVSLVTGLVERFRSIFSIEEGKSSNEGILGIGKGIIGGVIGAIGTFLSENTPLGLIGSLVTRLLGEFGITDKKGGGKESTDEGILGIGKGILGGIIGGFAADLDVPGVWSATVEKVRSTLSTAFDNVQNTFKSIGETVSGWIRGPIEAALNWARSQRAGDGQPNFFGGPIKRAFGGNINYRPPMTAPPGMMFGGKMKKFAMGSFVPGIGNTDTVPALLTPGEFVVRKSVAQTYGPLLNALNSDVFPKMTMTSLMPSSSKTSSDGQISYNYAINVNVSGSNASPDDIANTVMSKIKMMESRNIRGTRIG